MYMYCIDVVSWSPCPERAACGQVQLNSAGAKGNCLAMGLSSRKHRPCVEVNIIPTACLDGMNIRHTHPIFCCGSKIKVWIKPWSHTRSGPPMPTFRNDLTQTFGMIYCFGELMFGPEMVACSWGSCSATINLAKLPSNKLL